MDIIIETKSTNVDITEPVTTRVISVPSGKQGEQGIQGIRGEDGISGTTGVGLEYVWDGTSLGVKREDETEYSYTNLKGDKGDDGDTLWEADSTTNIKPSNGKTVKYSYLSETPDIPINSDFTLSGLGEKSYTNLTDKPSIPINSDFTLSGLSEKSYTNLTNTPTIPTNSDFNLASLGDVNDTDKAEGKIISVDSEGNHVYISNAVGTDEKVKFDSEDPTAGYITDKFWGNDGVGTEEGTGDGLNTLRIYNTDKGSTAVSSHLLAFDHNSFITGVDWDEISGTQTDISLSGFTNDLSYEVPLTFSTGLTRTANTITCNITQYEDSDAISAIKGDADWNAIDWDTAYGWGNHADAGYLTSETDPVFTAHPAFSITNTDITNLGNLSGTNTGDQESSDFDHNQLTNTHDLTTDIDHDSITNTHNLTTDINHNALSNYVVNEHIDWTAVSAGTIDPSNYVDNDTTYTAGTGLDLTGTVFENIDTGSSAIGTHEVTYDHSEYNTAYSNRIEGASLPLLKSGTNLSIIKASATTNGYLGTDDWNTFNNKLGNITEDTNPKLGGHLNMNHKGFIIENQTIEGTVVTNNLVLFDESWKKTDADLFKSADRQVGIYIGNNKIMLNGIFETTALSANKVYYISTTPGAITITAPSGSGDIVRIIGTSLSTTNLLFYPSQTYLELV